MDNKERSVTDSDHHFVFVRPKAIVGSCGSVWASETIKLRHLYPEVYECLFCWSQLHKTIEASSCSNRTFNQTIYVNDRR